MPTRAGYSFLGWRGKNLVKVSNFLTTSENCYGITATPDFSDGSIILNGYKEESASDTFVYEMVSILKTGVTYYFYEKEPQDAYRVQCMFVVDFVGDEPHYYLGEYTPVGGEKRIGLYVEGIPYRTYENRKVKPILEEGQKTQYEPYYIESDTVFGTPGDRTLTAMWSQDSILTGGALQSQSDLSNWSTGWGADYTPKIVTYDGLSCFKLDLRLNTISILAQSIKGKYDLGKYSITAKVNVVNAVAGTYDANNAGNTFPDLMLYFPGSYGSNNTWMAIFNSCNLRKHNNKGWVDIRFTSEAHYTYSDVSLSEVTGATASIYCRNFSGTLYIRDFAVAKM